MGVRREHEAIAKLIREPDPAERRQTVRRVDLASARLLLRVLALRRGFGPGTALRLLLAAGLDPALAAALLLQRVDRRKRTGRADIRHGAADQSPGSETSAP